MADRKIAYMKLSVLAPLVDNPKDHDVDGTLASVQRFGFIGTIGIDERTSQVIDGNGRVETLVAAQQQGLDPPDGIRVQKNGEWLVPVVRGWASKDDDEAIAAGIALNAVGEGLWHDDRLAPQLARLRESESGLSGVGLADERVAELLASTRAAEESRPSPFADFAEQQRPDTVDFRFGDYSGKLARPLYEKFVAAVEVQREATGAVLLDDVLAGWLSL